LLTDDVERQVFQQQKRTKQLLDGVVSSMKSGDDMEACSVSAVEREKSAEQWCFSIGKKNDEELLIMVFQQQKRKGETIARRC
jgi:hypothetical protein